MHIKFSLKLFILFLIVILNASCSRETIVVEEVKEIISEPVIENTYYEPLEEKEEHDIKGFIKRAKEKQLSESFDLRSMKFTAYLFEKLVCMNYMNTLFTKDIEARFTDNYSPKFDPNFGKNLHGKYDYFWTNKFGNLILQFGDKKQGIFGCGQIIFSSNKVFNKSDITHDVEKMIKNLNPVAKQLVTDIPLKKLKTKEFTNACKVFYKNNFDTVALNYQKKLPEFPVVSKELIQDYKNTRLKASGYINNAMFKGCTGEYIADESYKKTIQAFIENFIYCTECDFAK